MQVWYITFAFSPLSLVHGAGSFLNGEEWFGVFGMIRVVELGPFESRIDRGLVEALDDIPRGYVIKHMDDEDSPSTVYIEPYSKQDL